MRSLDRKLLRDLWRLRGQALAIALVLAAATATFVMSMGVHRSLTETRDAYYARNHFAEVFAGMTRAGARPGIERAGRRPRSRLPARSSGSSPMAASRFRPSGSRNSELTSSSPSILPAPRVPRG